MNGYQSEMQDLVQRFVGELADLYQRAVVDALGGGSTSGRRLSSRSFGEKRRPEELEALSAKFIDFVAKNPGLRIEQINKELGTTTKDLALPIRKLIAEGALKGKGQKRATTYFASGKGAKS